MNQIMAVKEGGEIPFDILEYYTRSYTGAYGLAYANIKNQSVISIKTKDKNIFMETAKTLTKEKLNGSGVIFFMGSLVDDDEMQPFFIEDDIAYVHEGWITGISETGAKSKSSSYYVHKKIFSQIRLHWLNNSFFQDTLAKTLGGSKTAFIQTNGKIFLGNEKTWSSCRGIYSSGVSVYDPSKTYNTTTKHDYFTISCSKCKSAMPNRSSVQLFFYHNGIKKSYWVCNHCMDKYASEINARKVGYHVN